MEGIAPSTFEWLLSYNKISYYQHHEHIKGDKFYIIFMGRIFFFKICDINYLIFGGYLYFNEEKNPIILLFIKNLLPFPLIIFKNNNK